MGYYVDIYRFSNSTEYEYKYAGKYGAKGEKRAPKKKPTKEQIEKQNQYYRANRVRRLIKANFWPNDLWITLKYPKGTKKPVAEVKKDLKTFLGKMRKEYKKIGKPLKFVYRMEIGEHGGIHIHMLMNRIRGETDSFTDIMVQQYWNNGRVNYTSIYATGGYKDLAAYIVKQPAAELEGQLSLFPETERKMLCSYSTSRNLVRPEPERIRYSRRTVRKLIEEGPKPKEGYYIEADSVRIGVNPYTGMSYLYYTESRIATRGGGDSEGGKNASGKSLHGIRYPDAEDRFRHRGVHS